MVSTIGRRDRARPWGALLLVLVLVAGGVAVFGLAAPVRAAAYPPLTGGIQGPTIVGVAQKATYTVTATGGPAEAPNGSQIGIYSFKASLAGLNTTAAGALLSPGSGVLVNGTAPLSLVAPNLTESLTIYVDVTSSFAGTNVSQNFSYFLNVVQPYRLQATLAVASSSAVAAFAVTVLLDGTPVGSVNVPTLQAGATYPLSFSYVTTGLSAGWHTFSLTLGQEHGLVTFSGGTQQFESTFYVPGPPTDYTPWYLAGFSAFAGAILILTMRVGARRRGRSKK